MWNLFWMERVQDALHKPYQQVIPVIQISDIRYPVGWQLFKAPFVQQFWKLNIRSKWQMIVIKACCVELTQGPCVSPSTEPQKNLVVYLCLFLAVKAREKELVDGVHGWQYTASKKVHNEQFSRCLFSVEWSPCSLPTPCHLTTDLLYNELPSWVNQRRPGQSL